MLSAATGQRGFITVRSRTINDAAIVGTAIYATGQDMLWW